MSLDDYTGIQESAKQHPLDFIRENLEKIPQSMMDYDIIDETVSDITLTDVYRYIAQIERNQNLPLKALRISYVPITDFQTFVQICDYRLISKVRFPSSAGQRIYFIENSDFATTLIPIELNDGSLNIFMEPLDASPDLITEMWAEHVEKKKAIDLALRNPWELNPPKKPST
jgi:hypothetical protein